ncbi:MAG: peptide chain release factor N(5)-glutamine methyltransferase, partial [Candidatus Omnitrophica bacterium]|nr:peptide chain release factor N(5)-glutamine methyltransferase [Candidatus Omnitrophota bacterium]
MIIQDGFSLIKWAEDELAMTSVENPRSDAESIFMHSFGMSREDVYLRKEFKPSDAQIKDFRKSVDLRATRYPLQYILKSVDFMGLRLSLEDGVFIPRVETELLVEKTIGIINLLGKKRINILEIGVGCGNIAISLTKNISGCKIIASDVSEKALKVATKNISKHGVRNKIRLIKSNVFDKISDVYYNYFDIILSNPPYVRRRDLKNLQPEVLRENRSSLDGGYDG